MQLKIKKILKIFKKKKHYFIILLIIFFIIGLGFLIIPLLNSLGCFQAKTYYLLLQNNGELRPSGGFMGSYAKLKFKSCKLTNFLVQDIYVPDGALQGHVEPPWPIQQAFQQGWWRLRDSNWEPDFPTASLQIQWFFEKGGEEPADGIIAVNLIPVKDLLKVTGPINLPDYQKEITNYNFVSFIQESAEKDFFPGSTQKKDVLNAFGKQLMFKLGHLTFKQKLQLIKAAFNNLQAKEILISLNDKRLNNIFSMLNWNGEIKRKYHDSRNLISDYLYLVDTNLGANKANFYVVRSVNQEINFGNNLLKEKLIISYKNNGLTTRPQPPDYWGGIYKNYLRVLLPMEAENIKIKINDNDYQNNLEVKNYEQKNIKSVGFFVIVEPQLTTTVEINYEKKFVQKHPVFKIFPTPGVKFILEIQKQPGIESYSHSLQVFPRSIKVEKNIRADEVIKINL